MRICQPGVFLRPCKTGILLTEEVDKTLKDKIEFAGAAFCIINPIVRIELISRKIGEKSIHTLLIVCERIGPTKDLIVIIVDVVQTLIQAGYSNISTSYVYFLLLCVIV